MKKMIMIALAAAPLFAEQLSYEDAKRDVSSYISQSADEQLFLEPVLREELTDLADRITLDAGRSIGVFGMGDRSASERSAVALFQGDVSSLPVENESLDRLLSLNIGAAIPTTVYMHGNSQGLIAHCSELARVMKEGGKMIIVAPASYDQVFTDGSLNEEALTAKIERVLSRVGSSEDPDHIMKQLEELTEVNRATFVRRGDRLILVTDMSDLKLGEPIWRKEPDGIKLSYFHNEEEYLIAFKAVGLTCEEIRRPCFFGRVKHRLYNSSLPKSEKGLGDSYIDNNPFTIFTVVKSV